MKTSHQWLQSYFKDKIPGAEKLADLFNMHAFEVEGIETKHGDSVLDLKILPDRAHYALCHRGIAREIAVITGLRMETRSSSPLHIDTHISAPHISVTETHLCSRYLARRIEHVEVRESPESLREKLETIGQRSINAVVDATNYVMLDIGQPLHAFDADKIKGGISVRLAKENEPITLLDGREVPLQASDLIIADEAGPLAIAGVKGGKRAEVTEQTKNIVLESANFNPTSIRRTATRLNLRNDSSKRFENEITPALCEEALGQVTALISSLCKEAVIGESADVYPHPAKAWTVVVSPEDISSLIGTSISLQEMKKILEDMNCTIDISEDKKEIRVTPPQDRLDLKIPEDIADEIGRIHGYEKLKPVLPPKLEGETHIDKVFYYAEKVKNILVEAGFSETLLYTLVPKGHFEIAYPLASDKAALRESLAPKLINALTMNARNADLLELDAIKIFEIGKVFPKTGEHMSLCLGVSINRKKKGVTPHSILKEALASIEKDLHVTIPIQENIAVIEIDLDALIEHLPEPKTLHDLHFKTLPKDKKYIPFSAYPFASRDIAVFVPSDVSESEVADVIQKKAGSYLLKMKLFDVFTKNAKTSYAFRLIFQSYEKTLEEKEIVDAITAVTEALTKKGWEVR